MESIVDAVEAIHFTTFYVLFQRLLASELHGSFRFVQVVQRYQLDASRNHVQDLVRKVARQHVARVQYLLTKPVRVCVNTDKEFGVLPGEPEQVPRKAAAILYAVARDIQLRARRPRFSAGADHVVEGV